MWPVVTVNQRFPSGPATIPNDWAVGAGYSVIAYAGFVGEGVGEGGKLVGLGVGLGVGL
jgi:hypothetical protein